MSVRAKNRALRVEKWLRIYRIPRACGGEPKYGEENFYISLYSPRLRG